MRLWAGVEAETGVGDGLEVGAFLRVEAATFFIHFFPISFLHQE